MTQTCRNCGSADLYTNPVQLENMARSNGMLASTWYFNLRVCVACGLADWFLAKQDLEWVKRKFSPPAKSATPELLDEVKAVLNAGEKITAINLYRSATGVSLSEAKDFVEDIQRRGAEE
jgi:hypothetical protein